jgi:hypothetical protein
MGESKFELVKCSCGQRDKDKCNKENGLNQGKMCLKGAVDKIETLSRAYSQAKQDGTITTFEGPLNIPARDKTQAAIAKPNDLTVEEAFSIAFDRYEITLEELAKK